MHYLWALAVLLGLVLISNIPLWEIYPSSVEQLRSEMSRNEVVAFGWENSKILYRKKSGFSLSTWSVLFPDDLPEELERQLFVERRLPVQYLPKFASWPRT